MSSKLIQIGSGIYDVFRSDVLARKVDFGGPINVALMTSRHTFLAHNTYWSDVRTSEAKGAGYTSGGQTLGDFTITRKNGGIMLDADNTIWFSAKFTARHAVMFFKETGRLICSWDFVYDRVGGGGIFTVQWHKKGLITEDNPDDPPQYFTYYLKEAK